MVLFLEAVSKRISILSSLRLSLVLLIPINILQTAFWNTFFKISRFITHITQIQLPQREEYLSTTSPVRCSLKPIWASSARLVILGFCFKPLICIDRAWSPLKLTFSFFNLSLATQLILAFTIISPLTAKRWFLVGLYRELCCLCLFHLKFSS